MRRILVSHSTSLKERASHASLAPHLALGGGPLMAPRSATPTVRAARKRAALAALATVLGVLALVSLLLRHRDAEGRGAAASASSARDDAPAPPPYATASSGRWSAEASRWVAERVGERLGRLRRPRPASGFGSAPHPSQAFPEFQQKMYHLTASEWGPYEARLAEFAQRSLPDRMARWARRTLRQHGPVGSGAGGRGGRRAAMPRVIWQTGKELPSERNSFQDVNPSASYRFFDDEALRAWEAAHFPQCRVDDVWGGMERPVLKADFWRYLVLFVEGGYYSDLDTDCLKPIERWGNVDTVVWDLGDKVSADVLRSPPQLVVGVEVDVPDITGWESFWPRPIQIVQWTFAAAPGHPVMLDSVRRVVESMEEVKAWERERKQQAADLIGAFSRQLTSEESTLKERRERLKSDELLDELRTLLTVDPFDREQGGKMSLIEATGPGAFSDAVISYLQARYGIHWSQLHDIQTATRIGDVAILPITGFAPFYKPDWQRWKGIDKGPMAVVGDRTHPQAMVNHNFAGSWRSDSDNAI